MLLDKSIINNERHNYPPYPELMMLSVLGILVLVFCNVVPVQIWGHKTISVFDIWTIQHVVSGMTVSYITIGMRNKFFHPLALMLLFVITWEVWEHYGETVTPPAIMAWFGGTEHWVNRMIADPMAAILGFYLIKTHPYMISYARYFSIVFIGFHLVVGSSMYFH